MDERLFNWHAMEILSTFEITVSCSKCFGSLQVKEQHVIKSRLMGASPPSGSGAEQVGTSLLTLAKPLLETKRAGGCYP